MPLSEVQIDRYSRQIVLPEVGGRGEEALLSSAVAIIGAGQLARLTALYLAGAGIGSLAVLALTDDAGLEWFRNEIPDLNPDVTVAAGTFLHSAGPSNAWAERFHVLVDTSGDPVTLDRLNAAALGNRLPLVAGGVDGSRGWLAVFAGHDGAAPYWRCADIERRLASGRCADTPLTPAVTGVIASLQALEVIKWRLATGTAAPGTWLQYDAEALTMDEVRISKRPDCSACGPATSARI